MGGGQNKRKPTMVKWEQVCTPKKAGGLGLKDVRLWNVAAIGKQVWHLAAKKDFLWVRWVAGIYLKDDDFWLHQALASSSWYWRKLLDVRDQLRQGFRGAVWSGTVTGEYTVSSGYQWLQGVQPQCVMWKGIWKCNAVPRHAFLMWLVQQERLYTLDRIQRWSAAPVYDICVLCAKEVETHKHLFFRCEYSSSILTLLAQWLQIRRLAMTWNQWRRWFVHLSKHQTWRHKLWCACLDAAAYEVWSERNAQRHESQAIDAGQRVRQIQRAILIRFTGEMAPRRAADCAYYQCLKC